MARVNSTKMETSQRQQVAERIISTAINRKRVKIEVCDYGVWIDVIIKFGIFYQSEIKLKLDEVQHNRQSSDDVSLLTDFTGENPPRVDVYLGWRKAFFCTVPFQVFLNVHKEYTRRKKRKAQKDEDYELNYSAKLARKYEEKLKVNRGDLFYFAENAMDAFAFLRNPNEDLKLAPISILQMEVEFIKLKDFYKTHHCDTKQHDDNDKGND